MERHHQHSIIPSLTSPAPTTFVQADTTTFRELVQKLTGLTAADSSSSDKVPVTGTNVNRSPSTSSKPSIPVDPTAPRRSPFKLQERRQTMRKLEIKLGLTTLRGSPPSHHHHHNHHHYSPRQTHRVDSPIPSPVTPLSSDYSLFFPSSGTASPSSPAQLSEEDKAIAEKGFYFHPSPLSTPRANDPPELLTLFPLTSPTQHTRD